jgi:3-oxoadipate enol-lactonase
VNDRRSQLEGSRIMPSLRANGIEMYYEEAGSGPPLLLLNHEGGTTLDWAALLPALTDRFRVITFDARGSRRSSAPPGPYSTRQLADDAAAVLDHVGAARAHVVGLSLGGMIAQELALARPERVDRLALVATHARPTSPAFWDAWTTCFVQAQERGLDRTGAVQWFLAWMFTPAFMARHEQVQEMMAQWQDDPLQAPAHGRAAQGAAARDHDALARLPLIAAPTLVVVGEQDILTPVATARELADGIPGARLQVLEGGGHLALFECEAAFTNVLLAFLDN